MGSHTATHIDAPFHVDNNGLKLSDLSLLNMVGDCQVFDFSYLQAGDSIKIEDFEKAGGVKIGSRILVKTSNSIRGFDEFYDDFVY